MDFEWDESKNERTLRTRGIDFYDAALIWDDPYRQERLDTRNDYEEARYQTIGKSPDGILFVVYTDRISRDQQPVTRIISARVANAKEIRQYWSFSFAIGLIS